MAKKDKNRKYRVTMHGEYFSTRDGNSNLERYEETFTVSQKIVDLDDTDGGLKKAWVTKCHKLGYMHEKKNEDGSQRYPGFQRLYTWFVKEVEPMDDSELDEPQLMNPAQLRAYIKENDYPIESVLYPEDGMLKVAVLEYEVAVREKTTKLWLERQAARMAKREGMIDLLAELDELGKLDEEDFDTKPKAKGGRPKKVETSNVV